MRRAILIVIPVAVVAVACGGGGAADSGRWMAGHSMAGHSMGLSSAPATTGHNSQDVTFAQMMIPHHQQAVMMADLAPTRAASPEVKSLAAGIKNAQQREIEKMTGWLKQWGAPTSSPGAMHMAGGMMSERDMKRLGTLSGRPFDKMFLQMMIKHHQGAITMAKTEREQGADADAKALARSITTSQSAEIAKMRSLLKNM